MSSRLKSTSAAGHGGWSQPSAAHPVKRRKRKCHPDRLPHPRHRRKRRSPAPPPRRRDDECMVAGHRSNGRVLRRYATIVGDPPWPYRNRHPKACPPYPTITVPRLIALGPQIRALATPDAHLYLWVTKDFLASGFEVLTAWGFQYKNIITWDKDRMGLGSWFRNQTEYMLFGVRGKLPLLRRDIRNLIRERSKSHSKRPEMAYYFIETASPGPRLELFARERHPGWSAWGNEVESDVQIIVPAHAEEMAATTSRRRATKENSVMAGHGGPNGESTIINITKESIMAVPMTKTSTNAGRREDHDRESRTKPERISAKSGTKGLRWQKDPASKMSRVPGKSRSDESAKPHGSHDPARAKKRAVSSISNKATVGRQRRRESATVADLHAAIAESIPEEAAEMHVLFGYLHRMHASVTRALSRVAILQWRMGRVLIQIRDQTKHGNWEDRIEAECPFSLSSAKNYIVAAEYCSEGEAETTKPTTLYKLARRRRDDAQDSTKESEASETQALPPPRLTPGKLKQKLKALRDSTLAMCNAVSANDGAAIKGIYEESKIDAIKDLDTMLEYVEATTSNLTNTATAIKRVREAIQAALEDELT